VLSHKAAIQCQNKDELINSIVALYEQPVYRNALAEKGMEFVRQNQGAIARICEVLDRDI
jgi:3-deoxy-D-manno-octulosonic-acid transferase